MNSLEKHYWSVIREDMCLKNRNLNLHKLPTLKKIELKTNFTLDEAFLFLELIGHSKPCFVQINKNQKGIITGCKLTLRKKNIFIFLQTWIIEIIPFNKDFGTWKDQKLEIQILDPFLSKEIRRFYLFFEKLSTVKIQLFFFNGSEDFCQSLRIPRDK